MADNLPVGTIRTNCQVVSIELDPLTHSPQLLLSNGSILQAKVIFVCIFSHVHIANIASFFLGENGCRQKVKLSCESVSCYTKWIRIITQVHACNMFILQVVIGCDGVNSAIANMFGLHRTKLLLFSTCVARGFTNFPNGHQFASEFVVMSRGQVQLGRIPVSDQLVYWFVTRPRTSKGLVSSN